MISEKLKEWREHRPVVFMVVSCALALVVAVPGAQLPYPWGNVYLVGFVVVLVGVMFGERALRRRLRSR